MATNVEAAPVAKETPRLISSDKVAGRRVENPNGDNLGHIEDVMIDKVTGQVDYAVLNYGSFLGVGGRLFAMPWAMMKYDRQRDAYVVGIPEETLKNAPSFDAAQAWPDMGDHAFGSEIRDYYGSVAASIV